VERKGGAAASAAGRNPTETRGSDGSVSGEGAADAAAAAAAAGTEGNSKMKSSPLLLFELILVLSPPFKLLSLLLSPPFHDLSPLLLLSLFWFQSRWEFGEKTRGRGKVNFVFFFFFFLLLQEPLLFLWLLCLLSLLRSGRRCCPCSGFGRRCCPCSGFGRRCCPCSGFGRRSSRAASVWRKRKGERERK